MSARTASSGLIGNNVLIIWLIGQDGCGWVFRTRRPPEVPQTGRVLLQNDVEVGAGTTVVAAACATP
jgi:UDP-3-O-[3-hydroxymyristoyl] glucosamine N-acyltransferase